MNMRFLCLGAMLYLCYTALTFQTLESAEIVGRIADKDVSLEEFERELDAAIANYRQQNRSADLSDDLIIQLSDQTWQRMVQSEVLERQIRIRNIEVTEDDVRNAIQSDPPKEVIQMPALQTKGKFDPGKYMLALQQDSQFQSAVENFVRSSLPFEKLKDSVVQEAGITSDSLRFEYARQNDEMFGKLLFFDYTRVPQPAVTDSEIVAYYATDRQSDPEINCGPYASLQYVVFDLKPSNADFEAMKPEIDAIYDDLLRGVDFASLARWESDDPGSAQQGGSLGTFGKDMMVPEFDAIAFALRPGQISPPFKTQFGWHIVKVVTFGVGNQGEPTVTASHILKKVTPSDDTKNDLIAQADRLRAAALTQGLESAAGKYGLEVRSAGPVLNSMEYIPDLGRINGLSEFARKGAKSDISEVVTDRHGNLYLAEITDQSSEPVLPLALVRDKIHARLSKQKQVDSMLKTAREFVRANKSKNYLTAAYENLDIRIINLQNLRMDTTIPEVGNSNLINSHALALSNGQVSNLIETNDGQFIIICENRVRPDFDAFDRDTELQTKLRNKLEEQAWNRWFYQIMQNTNTHDNRARFGY